MTVAESVRTISDMFLRFVLLLSESNVTLCGSVTSVVNWWRSDPTDMVSIVNIVYVYIYCWWLLICLGHVDTVGAGMLAVKCTNLTVVLFISGVNKYKCH